MFNLAYTRLEDSAISQCSVTGVASARDGVIERCCRP